jgi:hypothetical protein
LHTKPRRRSAIHYLHVHYGLTFHLSVNQTLTKGNSVDVGLLLRRIQDIGGEFASLDALVIVQGDTDAQLPLLTVCHAS